jgi:hypothetical protein
MRLARNKTKTKKLSRTYCKYYIDKRGNLIETIKKNKKFITIITSQKGKIKVK